VALVMLKLGVNAREAKRRTEATEGNMRKALQE
jgi:N-acetylmuramic acid 6-phosphate (MurNAc-6-P) etherase